jgi:hypothetical protein
MPVWQTQCPEFKLHYSLKKKVKKGKKRKKKGS